MKIWAILEIITDNFLGQGVSKSFAQPIWLGGGFMVGGNAS